MKKSKLEQLCRQLASVHKSTVVGIVREAIKGRPIIDFGTYHSHILRIIMQKNVKRGNTSV